MMTQLCTEDSLVIREARCPKLSQPAVMFVEVLDSPRRQKAFAGKPGLLAFLVRKLRYDNYACSYSLNPEQLGIKTSRLTSRQDKSAYFCEIIFVWSSELALSLAIGFYSTSQFGMKCTERGAKTFGNCLKNTTEQKALFDLIFLSVKITVHKCILFTWPPSLRVLSLRVRNRIAREDRVHNADWLKKNP